MVTLRITADVPSDRRLVLTLPAEMPEGRAALVVTVDSLIAKPRRPRTSLAERATESAEDWGEQINSEDGASFTGRRF